MKRQSMKRQDIVDFWKLCENCNIYITSKEHEKHTECCQFNTLINTNSYIRDDIFYTNQLDEKAPSEDIADLSEKQINNLIFLSKLTMQTCNIQLGDFVIINITDSNETNIIRRAWPTTDRFLTKIFVSKNEFEKNWGNNGENVQYKIRKLKKDPFPASRIVLCHVNPDDYDPNACNDLIRMIKIEGYFNVFCVNNIIKFDFFHKTFQLRIKTIIGKNADDLDVIGAQMKNLSICNELKNDFYIVTQKTDFEIENKTENENNDNDEIIENKINMIGGLDSVISEIKDAMNLALGYTKAISGLKISRGMLLHGPPGCGKSILCDAISSLSGSLEIKLNAAEIFSKYYGETETNLSQYFTKACDNYPQPSIIIIEDIHSICPKAENSDTVKRIAASLMSHFDNLHSTKKGSRVFVIATTNNPDNLNPSVRRSGRLDYEVEIPVPSPSQRKEILLKHLSKIGNSLSVEEISEIATITHGFVGADLVSLLSKAMMNVMKRPQSSTNDSGVQFSDVQLALGYVKASAMREVLIENPNIRWTDIGGQHDLKLKLKQAIEWPITHPEVFDRLGIKPPRGVLMFGPPGCSKTMIAKALATESKVNFLSIKGSELFSMWVGESERAVRDLFRKARQVAPAIIFFDEIDAIGSERSSDSGSSVKERVLAQMLTEMDGVNSLNHVTIVAATNRPDLIDKALMRPGRIDRIVYVKLPDEETRLEIFRIKTAKMPIEADVNLDDLVRATSGYSGAEVQAVCHEAALKALEESFDAIIVNWKHFQHALQIVRPRTSKELLELYEKYVQEF